MNKKVNLILYLLLGFWIFNSSCSEFNQNESNVDNSLEDEIENILDSKVPDF